MKTKRLVRFATLLMLWPFLLACPFAKGDDNNTKTSAAALVLLNNQSGSTTCTSFTLTGNWADTSDSNAPYTIAGTSFTRLAYLGMSPKTDYTMTIIADSSSGATSGVLKMSGLQLDWSAYPIISTLSNTIFQRIRFVATDPCTFYYCIESYNKASLASLDADTTTYTFTGPADATCGVFTWSKMIRQ